LEFYHTVKRPLTNQARRSGAMLPVIVAAARRDRAAYVGELKRALRAYLEPLERR